MIARSETFSMKTGDTVRIDATHHQHPGKVGTLLVIDGGGALVDIDGIPTLFGSNYVRPVVKH